MRGFLVPDVVWEYDDRAIHNSRGRAMTATVVKVLERSRTDEALYVRGSLPDGRTVDVDLADSDQFGRRRANRCGSRLIPPT